MSRAIGMSMKPAPLRPCCEVAEYTCCVCGELIEGEIMRYSLLGRHEIEEVALFTHVGDCEFGVRDALAECFEWRTREKGASDETIR